MASSTYQVHVVRNKNEPAPDHHIVRKPTTGLLAYLPFWSSASNKDITDNSDKIASFRNPWPSFHKPTKQELWDSLSFGPDNDPCLQLAVSHISGASSTDTSRTTRDKQAAELLRIVKPDFSFNPTRHRTKSTWLGHASMLLQLPPLKADGQPIRVLFDPIFSMRCSPSQVVGPIRSYPPPCKIEHLPPVDFCVISHSHYDHLDYDSVKTLWKLHKSRLRFIIPSKNRAWFVECGVAAERVEELDWWEYASVTVADTKDAYLKITCTPAQHSSGRDGADADSTLWSSWFLEHKGISTESYKIFFAGDSGYQFHSDPNWPPGPPRDASNPKSTKSRPSRLRDRGTTHSSEENYPPCPAFREIADRLGPPQLLYLPLALGATWTYLKSFFSNYLPDSVDPFPRHSSGVTGAIHMPPWDTVRVLREMTDRVDFEADPPMAIGMHWGTFVTNPNEVLKTLGQLEWACSQQGVRFGREVAASKNHNSERGQILALNHGESVLT